MEICVKARDAYLADGGFLNLKEFWRKEEYLNKYGIPYSTYLEYVHNDKSNRTPLYTYTGPKYEAARITKKVQKTTQPDNLNPLDLVSDSWRSRNQLNIRMSQHFLNNQQEKRESQQEKQYRRMCCNFRHSYITPSQKNAVQEWWKHHGLSIYCELVGANEAWMKDELKLVKECEGTFGPLEVYYEGPRLSKKKATSIWLQESSDIGKAKTKKRRIRKTNEINRFELM